MMTTWRDYLLNKCYTHTWMVYIPGLPPDLDYPEILGLRVPLATLVLNDNEDQLFTLAGDAAGRPDLVGGLRQGRRRRPVQVLVLSGPPQVRPPHASRGIRLVRSVAEGMIGSIEGHASSTDHPVAPGRICGI